MDTEKLIKAWTDNTSEDPSLAAELERLAAAGNTEALRDRFYRTLSFGTGGLRGIIGAGPNRMNVYTVGQATQGLARYILHSGLPKKVAVACDTRRNSGIFAMHAVRVLAANGIPALLFPAPAPTPALSFAVRRHRCGAGICVTASHNPAQYNGYKVYGPNGCQITDAAATAIQSAICGVDIFNDVKCISERRALESGLVTYVSPETEQAYLNAVMALRQEETSDDTLHVVYSPLNGTGRDAVAQVLASAGVHRLDWVEPQKNPDENFSTCPTPNPEEPEAMRLGLLYCEQTGADLLLATDPDCDRVGVAVKRGGGYTLLSGNEVGVLLLDYICQRRLANGTMPARPVAVKTIVTTEMAAAVAQAYGVELQNVLTGFKYIGEAIGRLESAGEADRFIFGFEESCGYLSGSHVRDKDGVNAAMLICDMAQHHKRNGQTLPQVLERLYERHGYYLTRLDSYTFAGEAGLGKMQALMETLRSKPMGHIGPLGVCGVRDYLWRTLAQAPAAGMPPSDVLQYSLDGGSLVTIRPSGTEPKLKVYYSVKNSDKQKAQALLAELRESIRRRVTE